MIRIKSIALLFAAATLLFGCGGGSSNDSDSGSNGTASQSGVSGTAAIGAPIEGGNVYLKCTSGSVYSGSTEAGGKWSADLQAADYPCAIRVTGGVTGGANKQANLLALYSFVQQPGTANITTFTNLLVATLTKQSPDAWFDNLTADSLKTQFTPEAISAAQKALQDSLAALPGGPSLPDGYDPVTVQFEAKAGDQNDALLDSYGSALQKAGVTHESAVMNIAMAQPLVAAATVTWPQQPIPKHLWSPDPAVLPESGNFIYLQSDAGDPIGQGNTYMYSQAATTLMVYVKEGHLSASVDGAQKWNGDFQAMSNVTLLQRGLYNNVQRYPDQGSSISGLNWSGEGRQCSQLSGWFAIDKIAFHKGQLHSLTMRFEQHCEGNPAALRGMIRWHASDTSNLPGPVTPVPSELWKPASGFTPPVGDYIYLESDAGDTVGNGDTYLYTSATANIALNAHGRYLSVNVDGNAQIWAGIFQGMDTITQLKPGYYGSLESYPSKNPYRGSQQWLRPDQSCIITTGWFVVDQATYTAGKLTSIDLRFEQHCGGNTPALHGKIHWSDIGTIIPEESNPSGFWSPAPGATPASGNYVYLQSSRGDYVGGEGTYTYTQATATLSVTANKGLLTVGVDGDEWWNGNFQVMDSMTDLQPGYYTNLQRWPFHDPAKGGLSWSGEGRGCNSVTGWFVIDQATYTAGKLTAIDLRFEQHCEGGSSYLRGKIHWSADDKTVPAGPVTPIPPDLWAPAAESTPASGSYVYLVSDPGDYVGAGKTYTYTSDFAINASGNKFSVTVGGITGWTGDFKGMNSITQLKPGYYGDLQRYPFNNPTKGGLDWSGFGRGCNKETGWFAVDKVTYTNGFLTAIELRFEQHCEGGAPALHGKIKWSQ